MRRTAADLPCSPSAYGGVCGQPGIVTQLITHSCLSESMVTACLQDPLRMSSGILGMVLASSVVL